MLFFSAVFRLSNSLLTFSLFFFCLLLILISGFITANSSWTLKKFDNEFWDKFDSEIISWGERSQRSDWLSHLEEKVSLWPVRRWGSQNVSNTQLTTFSCGKYWDYWFFSNIQKCFSHNFPKTILFCFWQWKANTTNQSLDSIWPFFRFANQV